MLGLVISLLIIALVVIINDIRIMNNNLTRFCLRSSANGLIYNQQDLTIWFVSYVYIFQGVHRIIYVYRNSVNKRNIICKLLRRFIGIVFFYAS